MSPKGNDCIDEILRNGVISHLFYIYIYVTCKTYFYLLQEQNFVSLPTESNCMEISAGPYAWTAIHSSLWWSIKSKINVLSDGPLTSLTKPRSLYD